MLTLCTADSIEIGTLIATASRDDTHQAEEHIICVAQHEGPPSSCT